MIDDDAMELARPARTADWWIKWVAAARMLIAAEAALAAADAQTIQKG